MAKQISTKALDSILNRSALLAIEYNSNAGYDVDATPEIKQCVFAMVKHYGITADELEQLVAYRHRFEKTLAKRYRIKFTNNMFEDVEAKLNKTKAPQYIKVKCGMLDFLIGYLNTSVVA